MKLTLDFHIFSYLWPPLEERDVQEEIQNMQNFNTNTVNFWIHISLLCYDLCIEKLVFVSSFCLTKI